MVVFPSVVLVGDAQFDSAIRPEFGPQVKRRGIRGLSLSPGRIAVTTLVIAKRFSPSLAKGSAMTGPSRIDQRVARFLAIVALGVCFGRATPAAAQARERPDMRHVRPRTDRLIVHCGSVRSMPVRDDGSTVTVHEKTSNLTVIGDTLT
jgi:hypothetical protein